MNQFLTLVALAAAALAAPLESRSVSPVSPDRPLLFHSHNDYTRNTPVYEAFRHDVRSFESDLWFNEDTKALLVAHTPFTLDNSKTFETQTLNRVLSILAGNHSHYGKGDAEKFVEHAKDHATSSPDWYHFYRYGFGGVRPLQLFVEVKSGNGDKAWPHVMKKLEGLRKKDFLTKVVDGKVHFRPVIVVGTGGTPLDQIAGGNERYAFFDCPLGDLDSPGEANGHKFRWTPFICPIASKGFLDVHKPYAGLLPANDDVRADFKKIIDQAHRYNTTARIYGQPTVPQDVRYRDFNMEVELGIDWLNLDDMGDAQRYGS